MITHSAIPFPMIGFPLDPNTPLSLFKLHDFVIFNIPEWKHPFMKQKCKKNLSVALFVSNSLHYFFPLMLLI